MTPVSTPTNNTTPSYTFTSNEAGTIAFGGSCKSATTSAVLGNNTIVLSQQDGTNFQDNSTYSDCTIQVIDNSCCGGGNKSNILSVRSFTIDTVKPVIALITAVPTLTDNNTPSFTFSSTKSGTITYGGNCSSLITVANSGNNTITFNSLADGTYSNCTIRVSDNATNQSSSLSVSSFTIDTTSPVVSSVSSSTGNGSYKMNDNISINVTFSEVVTVDNSSGNPRIQLETGTNDRYATYVSGSSSSILSFLYTVLSGDNSSDLDYKATDSLSANSGTIRDSATNNATLTLSSPGASGSLGANKAIVVDGIIPTVTNVSSSTDNGSYKINDNITVTVTFSENVIVDNSSGNPRVQLAARSDNNSYANYVSGNSTSILSFLYTVQSGDNSTNLDYTTTNSLSDNGSTIRDNASNNAMLTLPSPGENGSLGVNKAIVLDNIAPSISQVSAVKSPIDDSPLSYSFSSTEAGTISYGGSCSSSTTSASSGNNNITFNTLSEGYYSNCTINVTDAAGNISNTLEVSSFSIGAIILFNQTANYHLNGTTPTKSSGSFAAGINTVCSSSSQSLGINNHTVGVFATISSNLKDFVTGGITSRPVVSINNSLISNSWDELWDGAIDRSLNSAGVVSSSLWWSGTKGDGTKVTAINDNAAGNCNNFTSDSGWVGGAAGLNSATSEISTASGWGYTGNNSRLAEPLRPAWIGKYPDLGCNDELEIVCVAKPNF